MSAEWAGTRGLQHLRCATAHLDQPGMLGGLQYGSSEAAPLAWAGIDAPLLNPGTQWDVWLNDAPVSAGLHGRLSWRRSGDWLFGMLRLEEGGSADLATLSRTAYSEVFSALDEAAGGGWQLLRVWNYLARINAAENGQERYRQFNAGRQQAFQDHGRDTLAGSPAACAIGTREGPLCVYFLAGQAPAEPLENPRQVPAYHYPSQFGPRSPTFSRACLIQPAPGQCLLLISGTASIVGHETVHRGDVQAQTLETLRNLQAVIDTAHARTSARFTLADLACTVYVRNAADLPVIRATLASALGGQANALRDMVLLEADICRADLLIEIEAHATAPGVPIR